MKVLLLAGQFNQLKANQSYSFTNNQLLLSWQVDKLLNFTKDIVVVLDNNDADDALRANQNLMSCELAFDTNETDASFFTNLKTGLYLVNNFCVVLPLTTPLESSQVFSDLMNHYHKYANSNHVDLVQPYFPKQGQMKQTFPMLITFTGKQKILLQDEPDKDFIETLNISPYPVLTEPYLQPSTDKKTPLSQP